MKRSVQDNILSVLSIALERIGQRPVVCIGISSFLRSQCNDIAIDLIELGVTACDLNEGRNGLMGRIEAAADRNTGFLLFCDGLLNDLPKDELYGAIAGLHEIVDRFVLVRLAMRPSPHWDSNPRSLLPMATWTACFLACGFTPWDLPLGLGRAERHPNGDGEEHWIAADPFGDAAEGAFQYVLLEKRPAAEPNAAMQRVNFLVDAPYRIEKRKSMLLPEGTTLYFGISQFQDWAILLPLLEALPPAQTRVLIRLAFIEPSLLAAMRRYLARSGIAVHEYEDVGELPWSDLKGQMLAVGVDSTLGRGHLFSYELVAVARLHGCRTFSLQHGIWPRPYERRIITNASEAVITWGEEEERRLNQGRHPIHATDAAWGILPSDQAHRLGAPKFTDQVQMPHPGLGWKLGYPQGRFDRTVLLGLKDLSNRWGIDNLDHAFIERFGEMIDRNPRTLFLIRPHPIDGIEAAMRMSASNARILNDRVAIDGDLPLSRLMPGIDIVVTSPSTLILDAAVSDKPVIVYETGQPVEYDDVEPVGLDGVERLLASPSELGRLSAASRRFKARYAGAEDGDFYAKFSALLARQAAPGPIDRELAAAASLATQAVTALRDAAALRGRVADLERQLAALDGDHPKK